MAFAFPPLVGLATHLKLGQVVAAVISGQIDRPSFVSMAEIIPSPAEVFVSGAQARNAVPRGPCVAGEGIIYHFLQTMLKSSQLVLLFDLSTPRS